MAKKNVSEIERGVGYFMGLTTGLMDVARNDRVPFEAFYRLVTPRGRATLEKMVKVAMGDWQAEHPQLEPKPASGSEPPPPDCHVHVSYAKLPGIKVLEKKFSGQYSVISLFDGREWKRHSSCAKIVETPGERIFRLAKVPEQFLDKRLRDCWDKLAAHFDREGYRFAIETEAIEFVDAKPDAQRKNRIIPLGSMTLDDTNHWFVAALGVDGLHSERVVSGIWVDRNLLRQHRLLLVRK